jgi:hypothetical protein
MQVQPWVQGGGRQELLWRINVGLAEGVQQSSPFGWLEHLVDVVNCATQSFGLADVSRERGADCAHHCRHSAEGV